MKKITVLVMSWLLGVLFLSQSGIAYAQVSDCPAQFAALCNTGVITGGPGLIVTLIIVITIVVCLFFLIFGGIRWITSGGDKAKIASARSTLIAAVVGLVIAFLAFFIVNFVLTIFTGQGVGGMQLPTLVN